MFMFPPAETMRVLIAAWIVTSGFLAWGPTLPFVDKRVEHD
jgi:hypothetical protein